jgi:hypothetical protein
MSGMIDIVIQGQPQLDQKVRNLTGVDIDTILDQSAAVLLNRIRTTLTAIRGYHPLRV